MTSSGRSRILQTLLTTGTGILVGLTLWVNGVLTPWEGRLWDIHSRFFARPGAHTSDIVLVLLDQKSLEWTQSHLGIAWPWPRELYGAILEQCRRHQARAVGFDVLFTEPSAFGVGDDLALGKAIQGMGKFAAGSVFPGQAAGRHQQWPNDAPRPSFRLAQHAPSTQHPFPHYQTATLPIPEVAAAPAVLCNVHQDPDEDGIYRTLHPLASFDQQPLPALGIGVYLAAHPQWVVNWGQDFLTIGATTIPVDRQGKALLRFRGPAGTFPTISAAALLEAELSAREETTGTGKEDTATLETLHRQLHNKYVLFGFSAPGLFDLRPTPVGGIFSGVEINATLLDNLLANDFLRPAKPAPTLLLWGTILLAAGLLTSVYSGAVLLTGLSLFFALLPVAITLFCHQAGWRMELLPAESAVLVTLGMAIFIDYRHEGKQRRFIKHSFRHYLSPHVIEQLLEHPEKLRLGGERQEISIFFSDLQGFTTISEGLEPEALTALLNAYLSAMTDIILEEDGTVDKYEGDAIIAFWNAPVAVPDHAIRAVRAALRCQQKLAELRPHFKTQSGHDLYMRIGINSGPAVVGNLGSSSRFDYTMLGDTVNLAARLEGANKQFGSFLMISEACRAQLDDTIACRELAKLRVVGRKEPVRVYEPFFMTRYLENEVTYRRFDQGREAFYQGQLKEAIAAFSTIADSDPPAARYLQKCRELADQDMDNSWQGIWSLTSK